MNLTALYRVGDAVSWDAHTVCMITRGLSLQSPSIYGITETSPIRLWSSSIIYQKNDETAQKVVSTIERYVGQHQKKFR